MYQVLAFVAVAGSLIAFTDLPEEGMRIFNESVLAGQQIATAGDLRSMANMLDIHYLRKQRYVSEERFALWLSATFRESQSKKLTHDHWGNPYRYEVLDSGKAFRLTSAGPDGEFGTDDDMVYRGP